MGKSVHNDVLDGALDILKNNCTRITLCSQEPTTYAEANSTYALADVTVDSADFTNANGNTSGRMLTVGAQSGVTVDSTGTGTHLAYLDVANTKLLYVNEENTIQNSGTAQAGGATSITLAAGASASDDEYNDFYVRITGGTGEGQSRRITDYDGTTKVATVASAWGTNPDGTSTYEVFGQSVTSGNSMDIAEHDIAEIADPS